MGKTKGRRHVGRVARWNVHRTFGFIVEEENLKESFMHLDDVVGGEAPKIGDSVEFTKQISKCHDCDRARNVRILKQDDGAVQRGVCKFFDGVEGSILASSGRRIPVHALDCLNSVVPKRGDQLSFQVRKQQAVGVIGGSVSNEYLMREGRVVEHNYSGRCMHGWLQDL